MTSPIRCALIGVGMIGRAHLLALTSSPLAELAVCCDLSPAAREHVPAGVPLVEDIDEALSTAGLQAVFVCTPQDTHRAIAQRALERGLAVFCEKPIASSVPDADAMIATAERTGALLAIGHTLRFDPDYAAICSAVGRGEIGQVVSIATRRNVPAFEGRVIADRTSLAVEVLVHDLDLLRWLAGDIERVWAEQSTLGVLGAGRPDAVVATARMRSGAIATLESNWILGGDHRPESDFRLSVVGSEGSAHADYHTGPAAIFGRTTAFPRTGWLSDVHGVHAGVLRTQDEHFLRIVRDGGSWPVTLRDARAALAAALAIDASLAAETPIYLENA